MSREGRPNRRVTAEGGGRVLTKQAEADQADINRIMRKWKQTGVVPVREGEPLYGDFTTSVDYHTALNRVRKAEEDFGGLPAHIRKFCDNDAGKFLDLVMDAAGRAQLEELGMVSDFAPEGAPQPQGVETAAPESSPEGQASTSLSEPS